MSDLLTLAARVESAAGRGSRDLDKAITVAVLGGHCWMESRLGLNGRTPGRLVWTKPNGKKAPVPRYIASIDAAASLVPEGWIVVEIRQVGPDNWYTGLAREESDETEAGSFAPTEARSRTAAALKARAASDDTLPQGRDGEAGSVRSKGGAARSEAKGDART